MNALKSALRQIAPKLGPIVREHEILRVVGSLETPDALDDARTEVLKWAQKRSGSKLPIEAWEHESFENITGGRNSMAVRIKTADVDLWGIRAEDPDRSIAGRTWTTEVVIGRRGGELAQFSTRLLVNSPEPELDIEPHTPGFVQQVAKHCGLLRNDRPVALSAERIETEDQAASFIEFLVDPKRELPVFALTISAEIEQPVINADLLARATLGLAHVAVLGEEATWALTQEVGRVRSVFGGAVRAYLPSFSADAYPYSHRLVVGANLQSYQDRREWENWARRLAARESIIRTRIGREVLSFSALRSAREQLAQNTAQSVGAPESIQLVAAQRTIAAFEDRVRDLEEQLTFFGEEHQKAEERAASAEQQLATSSFRIQHLTSLLRDRSISLDDTTTLPSTWREFEDWCAQTLVGRVVLHSRASRMIRGPEYTDVETAARCLLWLANDYRDRRLSGGDGAVGEAPVLEGIRNAHCGGDAFEIEWQGQARTVDWHIKTGGNTRDPQRCLRIYHFWDSHSQQTIVAEMPAHRRTSAT